jgi:Ca-activated chloride channel family protein
VIAMRMIVVGLVAGWLADRFASTDRDVEAGIAAYESGEHDTALQHFDAAIARLGERPEIAFDRGLALLAKGDTQAAKGVFERATESEDAKVRSSAAYELGNLALDAEDFDGAIGHYVECLKAMPEHEHAKWNLELALLRKQKKEEEEQDQGSSESGGEESGGESGEESGEESGGESGEESGGESGEPDQKQDDQKQDDQKQDDQKQDDQKQDDQKQDDQKQDDQKQDDQKQDDQKQDDPKQAPKPEPDAKQPPPQPMDRFDLQRALDELDEQDEFPLDRARVRTAPPAKDW